jgi:sirohydrochlorin cobaltochelatase
VSTGLILFAHGSRDPEWVRPFEALRHAIASDVHDVQVSLAYLESASPDLRTAIEALAAAGVTTIRVLPLFLALGKHLRHDIPAMAADIAQSFPQLTIDFLPPLGDAPEFVEALGRIAARAARGA